MVYLLLIKDDYVTNLTKPINTGLTYWRKSELSKNSYEK